MTWLAQNSFRDLCHPTVRELVNEFETTGFPTHWTPAQIDGLPAWWYQGFIAYFSAKQAHETATMKAQMAKNRPMGGS